MAIQFVPINGTLQQLQCLNYMPGAGWGPAPPMILSAHSVPPDFYFANNNTALTISYGDPGGGVYNVAVLPTAGGAPTVHTTTNVQAQIANIGGGNYRITLTYIDLGASLGTRNESKETSIMATNYAINISMSQSTVQALLAGGYSLYGFKGVQTTMGGGAPLVWFQTPTFSLTTAISWEEQYQAYTSVSQIIPNGQIVASAAYDADLGQTLQVTGTTGTGSMVNSGTSGAISILNMTSPPTQLTCGISQMQNVGGASVATPLCAFPLYGTGLDVMAPIELVLLSFATQQVNTGTVIYRAYSQGVLINLTGVTERDVTFDINAGWSWGGYSWAQPVQANAELAPLLIDSSTSLSRRIMAASNVAPVLKAPQAATASNGNGGRGAHPLS